MILLIENTKDFTKKLLELINKFSDVADYKINPEISCTLYDKNKLSEGEIKKMIPFTIASKRIILRNKFNQECKTPVLEKL